jgi:hypothetical protein
LQRQTHLPCCAVELHECQQSIWLAAVPVAVGDVPAPAEEVRGPHPAAIPLRPACTDGGDTMLLQIAACGPRETHTRCCAIRRGIGRPCTCMLHAIYEGVYSGGRHARNRTTTCGRHESGFPAYTYSHITAPRCMVVLHCTGRWTFTHVVAHQGHFVVVLTSPLRVNWR